LIEAYSDGIDAAYRINKYAAYKTVPDNPYPLNSAEAKAWDDGFGDGTEDFIVAQRNDI